MRPWLALLVVLAMQGTAAGQTTPPVPIRTQPVPPPAEIRLPLPPEDPGVGRVTLEEAVRVALARQPDLRIPAAGVQAAAGRTVQARSGLLPSVNLNTGYTQQTPLSDTSDPSAANRVRQSGGSQASVVLNQLLWDFNRTNSEVGAARWTELAAEALYQAARADAALEVKQAFYELEGQEGLARVAEDNLENQRRNLALARARWESGLGLPADVVRAETAVAAATVNLNAARARTAGSRVRLARLMGIDPRTPLEVEPEPLEPIPEGDLNAAIDEALGRRPEMLAAERDVRAGEYALRAASVNAAPALNASAGVTSRGQNYPPDTWFVQYGVALSWPLIDSGFTEGLVQEAEANLEAAQARRDVVRQDLVSEVLQAWVQLDTALQSLQAAEAGEANAREAVRIAAGRYAAGLGDFLDVLDAQNAWLNASNGLVQARLTAGQARAAFERALGLPVDG